ncbi:MAG: 2'-5' RNA ligase family protein [Bacteroidetes bacterium]|nr:2'-5' RNA ligase family protein [Bacteroidota bacterium]
MYNKYFIAIVLTGELFEKAEQLKHDLFFRYGLKGALRSPAHITLHRPFQWKEEKEAVLIDALSEFKFGEQFSLELHNFNCFEPRVIYIDLHKNEQLFLLHKNLMHFACNRLKLYNEAEDLRGFHPHITIANRDLKKPLFYNLWEEFKSGQFSGTMNVNSIQLLKLETKWEVVKSFSI